MIPLILVDPLPRTLDMIFDAATRKRFGDLGRLVVSEQAPMPDAIVDRHLPETVAIVGQTDLPAERIERAPNLRAVINVEGNFLPNVDYAAALARGIHVLVASPAFAMPVAEAALGMAIDLARGIGAADRSMRTGTERYGLESNAGAFLLAGSPVGIIGFGDLGRALRHLLVPFGCPVRVHDPWLPDIAIRREGAEPTDLDSLLRGSRVVFVFAAATSDNARFLGGRELALIPDGGALLLMSRAAVVDFDALVREVGAGRLRARSTCSRGAAGARPSRARARGPSALAPPRRRDARGVPRDRPARGRRPRTRPARAASGGVQARRGRDGRPHALPPGRALLARRRETTRLT